MEGVDILKGKVEEVKKEVIVRPKTRVEGSRSRNRIEQVGLNNDRVRSEEGRMKKGEWTKVKGGKSKKVESLKCINVKNMFSVLDQIDEESNIVRDREEGTNDIVLGDSQVKDLGIGL